MALSTIELFAGVGMLGEGVGAGLAYMGMQHRPVCYVEREAYAASVLVARMQEGSLAQAPVWSDITTFDASQFTGKVDGILAGFPCQDLSIAGAREGLDGDRSGLFFKIPKIADACGAWFLFLENVAAIASATATVMDEEEGELEERAAARVLGELADRGWNAEWITLSASDVGASHGRARWFCFAWRQLVNTTGARQQESGPGDKRELSAQVECGLHNRPELAGGKLGNTGLQQLILQQREIRAKSQAADESMADAQSERNEPQCVRCRGSKKQPRIDSGGVILADAYRKRSQDSKQPGKPKQEECWDAPWAAITQLRYSHVADTNGAGFRELWQRESRPSDAVPGYLELFAPGPADARWGEILEQRPELAPALESTFCDLVNGVAYHMDDSRASRLRCVGNGVVALCAATALVLLARRSGIFKEIIYTNFK
ncbi:DNA cytosine methyltransferase [Undibacterium sp. Ji42W]|uniref:DNA cytosine methyltransferase n=1 Tax=Undibacterium sp. Ji42W TaxID=3413039 RepID=UPI003BF13B57